MKFVQSAPQQYSLHSDPALRSEMDMRVERPHNLSTLLRCMSLVMADTVAKILLHR